jgi:hypothetical protein
MGLLASIASNIGKAGGEYTEQLAKLSADKEAQEAKNQAEIEKEKRIEEAWSKHHDKTLSDLEQARINKLSDYKAEKTFDASLENDPTSLNYKVKSAQIDASRASANSSNAQASRYNTETGMLNNKKSMLDSYVSEQDPEKRKQILNDLTVLEGKDPYSIQESQLKLDNEKQVFALKDKVLNGTAEEQADALNKIQMLGGKEKTIIKTAKVQFGERDDGTPIMGDAMYREGKDGKVQWINPADELRKLNPTMGMSDADISALSTEMTNKQIGEKNNDGKFLGLGTGDKNNADKWDAANEANKVKIKNGMLNATPGVVAQGESVIKVDDPVTQKQIDTAMVVIKRHESGDKGSDAKNPASTAEGTYQLVDGTAKQYGAKVVNGDITGKEKDSVAPKYYADIYNKKAEGLISAQVAAGFGQEAIDKAVESAKKNGGINWWDYVESKAISNNMGSIKQRMKEVEQQLRADGTPVPMDISVFNQKYNVPAGIKKVERIDG